jgi:N-acetylneuraminic acid mutarotase
MPTSRGGLGVEVVSGKVYAIGGSNDNGELAVNEMFDPSTNRWSTKTSMPTARTGFATAVYNNKIYVIGGSVGDSFLGNVEVYDPVSNTWQTMASMPTPRADLSANVVEGKIYLFGGKTYSSISPFYNQTSINQVYDIATNTWSTNTSMPTPLQGYASTVVGTKIYVFGGAKLSVAGIDSSINTVQIFDTQTGTWSTGKALNTPSSYGAAVATMGVMAPAKIYYIGGYSSGTFSDKTRVYDVEQNVWSESAKMPTSRAYLGLAVVNDVVYAVGGFDGANWLSSNEEFKPVGYGKIPPEVEIVSPENRSYTNVEVSCKVNKAVSWVGYSIDDTINVTLAGNPSLTGLVDGEHFIVVYANDTLGNMGVSPKVYFTIDTIAPNITVLMPLEQNYNTADIPLTLILDEPATQLSYSIDGQPTVSITGNITLPALPDGNHHLTVYAVDALGNSGSSVEVEFSISTFPTFWVATAIASSIIILSSGYLFIKKVKSGEKIIKTDKIRKRKE